MEIKNATVKIINSKTKSFGTGFFIGNNLIVTCAHVVGESLDIELYWKGIEKISFSQCLINKEIDIAVFKVDDLPKNALALNLSTDFYPGMELVSYGYTDEYKNGAPVVTICEGLTGDNPPYIKFKQGRIRPGSSGSPLLKIHSRNVIGIIKYTSDRTFDIGGGAIPITSLVEHFDFLKESVILSHTVIPTLNSFSDNKFEDKKNLIYVRAVDSTLAHAEMWRWDTRMFKYRHPKAFGDFDLVGLELGRSWWARYPQGDWILSDWNDDQIGQYCIYPIGEEIYNDLMSGRKIETDLSPNDIIGKDEAHNQKYWYLANFMKAKLAPKVNKRASEYASNTMLCHILTNTLVSETFASHFGDDIHIVAFVEAKSVRKLVEENNFYKAIPLTKDTELEKIYCATWSAEKIKKRLQQLENFLDVTRPQIEEYKEKLPTIFQQPPNY